MANKLRWNRWLKKKRKNLQKWQFKTFLSPWTMSRLHVRSKVYMAPFHCGVKSVLGPAMCKTNLQTLPHRWTRTIPLIKGKNQFECDIFDNKFEDKNNLNLHIAKDHVICSVCQQVFPTITSLNRHKTAVHDNITVKHQVQKTPV